MGCGRVIRAHTLQRSGIIRGLIGADNHVLTFYPIRNDSQGRPRIHRVGWHQASTFFGFCDSHDAILFSDIETEPFVGSERQILLVGYRALCHELYQKEAGKNADSVLRENLDRGLPEFNQRLIQKHRAIVSAGGDTGLRELREVRRVYDGILRSEDYSQLHTTVLWFRGGPCVASTSIVHVDFDLDGNRLQNLDTDPSPIHRLTFGVISTPEGCAFVAAWPAAFRKCDDFIRSLLKRRPDVIPSLLTEFFFRLRRKYVFLRGLVVLTA